EASPVNRADDGGVVSRARAMLEEREQRGGRGAGGRVPEVPEQREEGGGRPLTVGAAVEQQPHQARDCVLIAIDVAVVERRDELSLAAPVAVPPRQERQDQPAARAGRRVARVAAQRGDQRGRAVLVRAVPVE